MQPIGAFCVDLNQARRRNFTGPLRLIQIKARFSTADTMAPKLLEGASEMVWSSTRILWDQQIFLLWILLPPIFLACGFLVFAAPLFFRDRAIQEADNDAGAEPSVVAIESAREAA
jgi:hypothetical protein